MNLWVDDERPAPEGWHHVKTAQDAIDLLSSGRVKNISLDHDLGPPEAGTGYHVATHIERGAFDGSLPKLGWNVHSANPIGRQRMIAALQNADRHWEKNESESHRWWPNLS